MRYEEPNMEIVCITELQNVICTSYNGGVDTDDEGTGGGTSKNDWV